MFCNLLADHFLKQRSSHISVAARRGRDPQNYVVNEAERLGDWQPEDDHNFFIQTLETCTCVKQQ